MPTTASLQRKPFWLDGRAVAWVQATFSGLTLEAKLAQLMIVPGLDMCPENLDRLAALGIGGYFRRAPGPVQSLRAVAERMQRRCAVPLLLCGDLELGVEGPIGGREGTAFPNQMAIAATGDPKWAAAMACVVAREGRTAGFNWSFSPVADLNVNFRSPVVSTRAFGDNPVTVARMVAAYIKALQAEGVAAGTKHWPGDGCDDRDQHFVTTINSLGFAAWDASYGRVFRSAIRAGVLSIMSAHIALPGLRGAGSTPASISRRLNLELLRGRLKFNGLILSDASTMAGLTSHGRRAALVPQLIENGCDMILFPADVELELGHLREALAKGVLSARRVDEAVWRVLALKAALGLHRSTAVSRPISRRLKKTHEHLAARCAEQAVTLVKDGNKLLPLSPLRHRRVLLVQQAPRLVSMASGQAASLQLDRLLAAAGFQVEHFDLQTEVHRDFYDVLIYVVAEEGYVGRGALELRWPELHGSWARSTERYWHDLPAIFISFGSPFHLREVPMCPTFINAYSPVPAMQEAVVRALTGEIPFRGRSPVRLPVGP